MFQPKTKYLRAFLLAMILTLIIAGTALATALSSSSQSPYVIGLRPFVSQAIFTVGDTVNNKPDGTPYRMVGIPDGLGAFDNGDGTFTLLMNHELSASVGVVRAHGSTGAFISKWTINKADLTVQHIEDLIQNVYLWGPNGYELQTATFSRFCSADLPALSAFYDAASGLGYNGRIFMNGEETGAEGRAFAHLMDGTSYQLPWLGRFSWENAVANPGTGPVTVVAGLDDSAGGQLYFYYGNKTNASNPVDAAGLSYGNLYGIKIEGIDAETNDTTLRRPANFTLYNFGDVSAMTGVQLEAASKDANGNYLATAFQRPEDGAWDPNNPNDFYFVTTASFTGKSRLWVVHFNDASNPAAGGTVEMLLTGTEGPKMMDNMTVNGRGQILIQEDPGNQPYVAKIWLYDIASDTVTVAAQHDPNRFVSGASNFLTQDEESSGIIDVSSILGDGWYLLVQQAHYAIGDTELVEGGQLLALYFSRGGRP